ncbi:MAG: ATP-binding protein [Actinomycetota bacterium]
MNQPDPGNSGRDTQESDTLLELIYDSVSDIIYLLSVEPGAIYRFESVNRAFLAATGLTREQLIGRRIEEVLPESSHALVLAHYRRAIDERQRVDWEEVAVYPAGTKVGEVNVAPIFDATGRCTHLIGAVHDVSERRQLDEQLRQAQKMEAVGRLAGGIAHDFNNLLTAIGGYAQLALDDPQLPSAVKGDLEQITRGAERATDLTRQLLAFSRRQVMRPEVLHLGDAIEEIAPMLRRLLGEDVQLVTNVDPMLGHVLVDPGQLNQVVMNLAVNARDAMPAGGTLTLEAVNVGLDAAYAQGHAEVAPGPYVVLSVTDTGSGMDEATQARLFEPFFTTKELGKGTGLGLSTVYGIVKQSGGHIWVYSELGRGTVFKVYLPRIEAAPEERKTPAVEPRHAEGTETILLAEDDSAVRALVRIVLEGRGYRVIEAATAHEAIEAASKHEGPIHLLLTDVVMPGLSGIELAERIGAIAPGLRVIYMSGYTENTIVHHGVLNPAVSFLAKPFSPGALAARVRADLDS